VGVWVGGCGEQAARVKPYRIWKCLAYIYIYIYIHTVCIIMILTQ